MYCDSDYAISRHGCAFQRVKFGLELKDHLCKVLDTEYGAVVILSRGRERGAERQASKQAFHGFYKFGTIERNAMTLANRRGHRGRQAGGGLVVGVFDHGLAPFSLYRTIIIIAFPCHCKRGATRQGNIALIDI